MDGIWLARFGSDTGGIIIPWDDLDDFLSGQNVLMLEPKNLADSHPRFKKKADQKFIPKAVTGSTR